jgi:effector-binding domain-containing protein
MKKRNVLVLLLLLMMLVIAAAVAQAGADPNSKGAEITEREVPAQTVLYTIVRGPYQKTGQAVGRLYALSGEKGIRPIGPPMYTYLNNPKRVSSEHWLTEIRIPVSSDALKLVGTLGEMTDVKQLPAVTVVVAVKPEGVTDPGPVYEKIYMWVRKNGYKTVDSASEVFLTNAASGDYAAMKAEIMVPVSKTGE